MTQRTSRWLALGLVVGSIVIAVVMIRTRPRPPRLESAPALPMVQARAAKLVSGPIMVVGSGTVRPRAEIELAFQVPGQVVFVDPALQGGGRVRAGQVLARLEDADYQNRVEQARADVAAQEVTVLQAEEEAAIARAEYEAFVARQRRLGVSDTIGAATALVLREPQLAAATAGLARAEAQLRDAELALARTAAVAPFDAVVRVENVDVGAYVAPGQSLARLYASDEVEVVVPLTDQDAALIPDLWSLRAGDAAEGVPAEVTFSYGGRRYTWPGYVDRAEAVLDTQSRTIDVIVRVPDPFTPSQEGGPPLLVGAYAEVAIAGAEFDAITEIPRGAIQPGDQVWAVEGDSVLRVIPVEVLQRTDQDAIVRGVLREGQLVVIGGIEIATDGMRVRVAGPGAG